MTKSTIAFALPLFLVLTWTPFETSAAAEEPPPFFAAVLSPGQIAELKETTRTVLSLEDNELLDLIPVESGGIFFTDCPNCDHGRQDRGRFEWSIQKPFHITCEGCGEIYPDNDKYPENEEIEVEHSTGTHRLPFYQAPSSGKQFFFSAHADFWRRMHLEQSAKQLAQLYSATGESRFAHRSALILAGFAEVYPNYVLAYDYPFRPVKFASPEEKAVPNVPIYRTSKWTWWGINEISINLTEAYDLIKGWDGWAELPVSQSRHKVREDLLSGMLRFVLETENWQRSTHQPRVGKLLVARTLGNPEAVHESIRRFKRLSKRFYYDGQYNTASPSYSEQMMNTLNRWIDAAAGYTDPADYVDPIDGNRFEDLDLSKLPFIQNFADAPLAYGAQVDSYQRILAAHANADGSLLYFIDRFNVSGYSQADYLLLGPLNNEAAVSSHELTGTPLEGNLMNAGVEFRQPKGESDPIGPEAAFGFFNSIVEFNPLESTRFVFLGDNHRDEKLVAWIDRPADLRS